MKNFCFFCIAVPFLLYTSLCIAQERLVVKEIHIGVLAEQGVEKAVARWTPTADYLSAQISGYRFLLLPLDVNEMAFAVENEQVQFVLTNPAHYVELEFRFGISRIATQQTKHFGRLSTQNGAVIISRRDNFAIVNLKDLRGKSFMAVSADDFAGFQMAWRELVEHDVDPFEDFSRLEFVGLPNNKVITAVLDGDIDAATVRAETLLHKVAEGKYTLSDLRILNLQTGTGTNVPTSTRLYPQAPFAKTKKTPAALVSKVILALLEMPDDHAAAVSSHDAGWAAPSDYSSVHELMKVLAIGPYLSLRQTSLEAIIKKHRIWVIVTSIALILLILTLVYILRTHRRLTESDRHLRSEIVERKESEATLANYKESLEERVVARTNDIDMVNQSLQKSQTALRNLVDITSSPRLSHEDKLARLLETGREYYQTAVASISSLDEYHKRLCVVADKRELFQNHVGPLNKICVQQAITQFNKPLDIPNLNIKTYKYPGCGSEVLNSYLATAVLVKGKPHYVLEFADIAERKLQYTHWDHNMLQLMARWIGSEIEKQDVVEEQQRNQTELARVGRMSAMGEMVAGLAHELNQPLTGAINYSSACLRRLKYEEFDREKLIVGLERAVEGATMAADIIRQLREFVKKGKSAKEPVDINVVVLKIVDLLSAEIRRHRTRVSLQLADNIPIILANEIQLEQVVLNFIRNSLDAMENTEVSLREIIITTELDYDKVRLFVMDFGNGIPANTEAEVFDAFYTTKSDGMGMGLSISRTIIEEHNGTIVANNNPESGACFSFEIPANSGSV